MIKIFLIKFGILSTFFLLYKIVDLDKNAYKKLDKTK